MPPAGDIADAEEATNRLRLMADGLGFIAAEITVVLYPAVTLGTDSDMCVIRRPLALAVTGVTPPEDDADIRRHVAKLLMKAQGYLVGLLVRRRLGDWAEVLPPSG